MQGARATKTFKASTVLLLGGSLCACNTASPTVTGSIGGREPPMAVSDAERDCLGRAMYFEANRSDADGLLAVGTVVLNRLGAAIFPGSICDVVGQRGQFASGVLTKPMQAKDLDKVADVADALLAGERHPKVAKAMYFHTAGHQFPYTNMHYVAVTGGNAFYEKRPAAARPASVHFAAQEPAPAAPGASAAAAAPSQEASAKR